MVERSRESRLVIVCIESLRRIQIAVWAHGRQTRRMRSPRYVGPAAPRPRAEKCTSGACLTMAAAAGVICATANNRFRGRVIRPPGAKQRLRGCVRLRCIFGLTGVALAALRRGADVSCRTHPRRLAANIGIRRTACLPEAESRGVNRVAAGCTAACSLGPTARCAALDASDLERRDPPPHSTGGRFGGQAPTVNRARRRSSRLAAAFAT